MIVKTRGIVLSSLKYGDSGKIIKVYTESSGLKSFIAKSVYSGKNKKNALFIPLNQIEIIFDDRNAHQLFYFKEISQIHHYISIYQSPAKTTIALFLTEILNSVLKEEEANPALFHFLKNSLIGFDQKETSYADFHLWFLINLTKYLGFYPNLKSGAKYFDLTNGVSSEEIPSEFYISESELQSFEKLVFLEFFQQNENNFNQLQRKSLLTTIIRYFELHISDFRHPKSLDVLNQVFE